MAIKKTDALTVELPPLELRHIVITLVGDSPLICHAWSAKAKKQMLDKQMGKASAGKEHKDPQRDYEESLYYLPDGGYGFPAVAFKAAAVSAARQLKDLPMTYLRGAFHINGDMVRIEGEPQPREDMVRIGMGTADIRYRGEFRDWRVSLSVRYNARAISAEQIINLLNVAGFAVGIGEWRPEKDGSFGMFHVAAADE